MISVITEITDITDVNGLVCYDGDCPVCVSLANRCRAMLRARGFELMPLQAPEIARRLENDPLGILGAMRVFAKDGTVFAGADAFVHLARFAWWGWPVRGVAWLPCGLPLLRGIYGWVARHRKCVGGNCAVRKRDGWPDWVPLLVLPLLSWFMGRDLCGWKLMWLLAASIFAGCKWLTWRAVLGAAPEIPRPAAARSFAYLLLWPGMDARAFLDSRCGPGAAAKCDWFSGITNTLFGAWLLWGLASSVPPRFDLLRGWIGMIGMVFLLHFGVFRLLASFWRSVGVKAEPIMDFPVGARTLGEFWGDRWNRGFSDFASRHMFDPLARRIGPGGATMVTFAASGIIHELVISVPAGAGYGLPMAYFVMQGACVLLQRRRSGKAAGARGKFVRRIFTLLIVAVPVFLAFHPPFVRRVILPFLQTIHVP